MTQQGAAELYMWLMAAWPLVIKANSSKAFQNAKIEQLFESYKGYSDEEVKHAIKVTDFKSSGQWVVMNVNTT